MTNLFEIELGLFSRDSERNFLSSRMWNISESGLCDTEEEFYSRVGQVDVAIVLTPTPNHSSQLKELFGRVGAVVCEKTVASSSAEGQDLGLAVSATLSRVFPIFNYSCFSQVRHLRALVDAGFLGDLIAVAARMPQQSFLMKESDSSPSKVQEWRLNDGHLSGVSLDLGSHLLHLIGFITQRRPLKVVAQGGHFGIQSDVLDLVQALMQLEGNVQASVDYGKVHLGYENGLSIEVFGSERSARWVQGAPDSLRISDNNGNQSFLTKSSHLYRESEEQKYDAFKPGHPTGFLEALGNFYDDVAKTLLPELRGFETNSAQNLPTLEDAVENLGYLELIEESIRERTWKSTDENTA
jgi:predicted dehydrogenase